MSTMTAQDLKLDYFKFYRYKLDNPAPGMHFQVVLTGQFDKGVEADLVLQPYFANPARKNGEPIYDPNAHLTFYKIFRPKPEPTRMLEVENQFGRRKIRIGQPLALLAPAQKVRMKPPEHLAHYKLYQVVQSDPMEAIVVELSDQFVKSEKVRIMGLFAFGVPVAKKYEGATSEIYNRKAHLMIYRIRSVQPQPLSLHRGIRDQFSGFTKPYRAVTFGQDFALAVPSVKLNWKEL